MRRVVAVAVAAACAPLLLTRCAHPEALLTPQTVQAVATIAAAPTVSPATIAAGATIIGAIIQAAKH